MSNFENLTEKWNWKQHYGVIGKTGSGKSYFLQQLFLRSPIPIIYFNTQLNDFRGGFTVSNPEQAFQLFIEGKKRIIYNPTISTANNYSVDNQINHLELQLKLLISRLVSYKYQLLQSNLIKKSQEIIVIIDEIHLFQDAHSIPSFIKFLSTSGRRLGIFLIVAGQEGQLINNRVKNQMEWIIGYHNTANYEYIKQFIPEVEPVDFKSWEFKFYDYEHKRVVTMKVIE